jgi:hypothetical protein
VLKLSIEKDEKVFMVVRNKIVGSIKHTNEDGKVAVTIRSYEKERSDVNFLKKENLPGYFDKKYEDREKNTINVVVKKSKETLSLKRKRR